MRRLTGPYADGNAVGVLCDVAVPRVSWEGPVYADGQAVGLSWPRGTRLCTWEAHMPTALPSARNRPNELGRCRPFAGMTRIRFGGLVIVSINLSARRAPLATYQLKITTNLYFSSAVMGPMLYFSTVIKSAMCFHVTTSGGPQR